MRILSSIYKMTAKIDWQNYWDFSSQLPENKPRSRSQLSSRQQSDGNGGNGSAEKWSVVADGARDLSQLGTGDTL